ncbi:phage head-binding domain-containing protein [Yersinia rochesterensis]|uniref:phage head-binding domain-containing protein n=1 Tax=Yersinia rochesterensis TaxID=1604335 RepID=UPI0011A4C3DD|nr:phage head-binding domain-containing protein [Yersinia rochesterensis]
MPDIIPNVVIGMPSQLFTMPRKFGAVFGGRIYIGLIDTDPTIPSNQIQVYLENEDGSLVPVAQPLLINAGGFPVYNGQIAKFVTVQGHSMAVYDALNVQQFYFPNVLKYDPDQFRQYLDSQGGAVTVDMLGEPTGASLVGVQPQGNLNQAINWVTPEQFGAIGDGTAHPLSERYATLAAAQAVYPHVTSLNQTIDWAACQAADNYARGVAIVKCPTYAKYHFGSTDYLELAIDSKWYGTKLTQTDRPCTTMIRTDPVVSPAFGQDCIVRVKNSAAAGSSDEFVRGVIFEGFRLTRNLARRPNVRGKNSIGLHLNFGMKAIIDVTINGCDFGVLGYGCWGSTGVVRIDSCHKGIYLDGNSSNPERAAGGALTSINWRVEIDISVFPITLNSCGYSQFTGFYEGLRDSYTDFYKKDIETACGITLGNYCSNVDFTLGIEAFQGTQLVTQTGNDITLNNYYLNDLSYNSSSGPNGAFAQIDGLMGRSTPQISSGSRAVIFTHGENNTITITNPEYFGGNIIDDPSYIRYFYNLTNSSRISTIGGYISLAPLFGLTRARFNIFRSLNTRNILTDYFPSGYTPIGADVATHTAWQTKVTSGGDGRVALDAPSGYKILDFTALVIGSTTSSPMVLGVLSSTDTQIQLQSNAGGVTVQYKLTIQITK